MKKNQQRATLVRDTMDNFRRIVQALRTSHRVAADVNLTGAQLFVLTVLRDAEGPISIGDVAREAQTDPSTASTVVKRLVDAGLVRRQTSSDDTRRMELSLTARGKSLLQKIPMGAPQRRLAKTLERLPQSQAAALARALDHIVEDMGLAGKPAPMMFSDEPKRR